MTRKLARLFGLALLLFWAGCSTTRPGDEDSSVRLIVKRGEPHVLFLDEAGVPDWQLLDVQYGRRGLIVMSLWWVDFPSSESRHDVQFDQIKRNSDDEATKFRALIDGEAYLYDSNLDGDKDYVDPPEG